MGHKSLDKMAVLAARIAAGILTATLTISATSLSKDSGDLKTGDSLAEGPTSSELFSHLDEYVIGGIVQDINGAVVPRAEVTLVPSGRKESKSQVLTDANGSFRFSGVGSGSFQIEVVAHGFKKLVFTNLDVAGDRELNRELVLEAAVISCPIIEHPAPGLPIQEAPKPVATVISLRGMEAVPRKTSFVSGWGASGEHPKGKTKKTKSRARKPKP